MIDPRIWDSCYDKNLSCQDFTVLIAAISSADDEGRGKISMIERAVGKMVNEKALHNSLKNLSDTIKVYNDIYYYLSNWSEYQALNRPKPSKLPNPTNGKANKQDELVSDKSLNDHGKMNDESLMSHGLINDESVTSHANSSVIRSRREVESEVEVEKETEKEKEPPPQMQVTKLFAIWGRVPDNAEKARTENLLKQHGWKRVWEAFHRASEMGKEKKNVAYVRGILSNPDRTKGDKFSRKIGEG